MESYEVAHYWTPTESPNESREVLYRTLDYTKSWARLAQEAEQLEIEIPDGAEWFNAPAHRLFEENYYVMEKVEIDE